MFCFRHFPGLPNLKDSPCLHFFKALFNPLLLLQRTNKKLILGTGYVINACIKSQIYDHAHHSSIVYLVAKVSEVTMYVPLHSTCINFPSTPLTSTCIVTGSLLCVVISTCPVSDRNTCYLESAFRQTWYLPRRWSST